LFDFALLIRILGILSTLVYLYFITKWEKRNELRKVYIALAVGLIVTIIIAILLSPYKTSFLFWYINSQKINRWFEGLIHGR